MNVVSFVNYKGGVGKTTLLLNIAAELAKEGKKVGVIDLDPQRSLTFSLMKPEEWNGEYRNKRTSKNWFDDKLNNKDSNLNDLFITNLKINNPNKNGKSKKYFELKEKIKLIPSDLGLFNIDLELAGKVVGEQKRAFARRKLDTLFMLKKEIDKFNKEFDYIFIDCHPNFDIITQNAIVASDYYVIPTKLDYLSTMGIEMIIDHIEKLLSEVNKSVEEFSFKGYCSSPQLLGVISNMVTISSGQNLISINENNKKEVKSEWALFPTSLRNNPEMMDMKELIPAALKKGINGTQRNISREIKEITEEFKRRINNVK